MACISFTIPCESNWSKGIYRLEVSDLVLGWDPVLAKDGPANRQWRELGDRTLYLKNILDKEHIDGHHQLTASNFTQNTKIPESRLALEYTTEDLAKSLKDLDARTSHAFDLLNQRDSLDLSPTGLLVRVLPWVEEYFSNGVTFDLINKVTSMRLFNYTTISKAIAGDDSLDVGNTDGIVEGSNYFLMDHDGSHLEEATVMSILTDTRIRFTTALRKTRTCGFLSSINIPPTESAALLNREFTYYSGWLDSLAGAESGKLFIHRDDVPVNGEVYYEDDYSPNLWRKADFSETVCFYDGTVDDIFILPPKRLRFRIYYPGINKSWKIHWLALKSETSLILPETVRHPQITLLELFGTRLSVRGTPFASLWHLPQAGFELRVSEKNNLVDTPLRYSVDGQSDGMVVDLPSDFVKGKKLVGAIRHQDCEGSYSRWSLSRDVITL